MMTTTPKLTAPQTPGRAAMATETKNGPGRQTGMPFSKEDPKRQQKLLIAGIGGAALVIALAMLFVFRPWQRSAPPRLNEEPSKVAQLLASPDFQKMPFERREIYMKMMDRKKAQITQAYANGQMSDVDYQKALEAAHLGKRLDEMKKYFSKPVGAERIAYLDKVLAKKDTKDQTIKRNPTAKQEKKEKGVFRDAAMEEAEVNTWPPEVQVQFRQFDQALEERKKLHKAAKPKKAPTTLEGASTRPGG